MRDSVHRSPPLAAEIGAPIGAGRSQSGPTRFAVAAKALWPQHTSAELAARCNCGVGTVKHWLRGREPSPVAISVIVDEITREFR